MQHLLNGHHGGQWSEGFFFILAACPLHCNYVRRRDGTAHYCLVCKCCTPGYITIIRRLVVTLIFAARFPFQKHKISILLLVSRGWSFRSVRLSPRGPPAKFLKTNNARFPRKNSHKTLKLNFENYTTSSWRRHRSRNGQRGRGRRIRGRRCNRRIL